MVKNPPVKAGDTGSIPGPGRSPGEANGNAFLPVLLPGKSHRQRSLASYSPWGHRVRHDLANKQQQMVMNLCHPKCALSSPSHPLVRTLTTCSQPFPLAGCRVLTPLNLFFSFSPRTIFVNHPLTSLNVIPFAWS